VTPLELLTALLNASNAKVLLDSEVVNFEMLELEKSQTTVSKVFLSNGKKFECDFVVIAAGPWSGNIVSQVILQANKCLVLHFE
jgi:L-2-hydroxyglutarate oxidase LhgO